MLHEYSCVSPANTFTILDTWCGELISYIDVHDEEDRSQCATLQNAAGHVWYGVRLSDIDTNNLLLPARQEGLDPLPYSAPDAVSCCPGEKPCWSLLI